MTSRADDQIDWQVQMLEFGFEYNYDYLREYLDLIDAKVSADTKRLEELEESIRNGTAKDSYDPETGYFYDVKDHLIDMAYERDGFQQHLYKSFLVSMFIILEDHLAEICAVMQKRLNQTFGYKDIAGSGVGRSINYLEKLLKRSPIKDETVKRDFYVAWKLRNAAVHADGIAKKEDLPMLTGFIEDNPDTLWIDESSRRIDLNFLYIKTLLKLSRSVSNEFLANLQIEDKQ